MATKPNKYTMSEAYDRARAKVGKSNQLNGCLAECINPAYNSPYDIPAPWGWGGNGKAWAINYWLNAVAKGLVVKTSDPAKVPTGALMFYIDNADIGKAKPAGAGHVSIKGQNSTNTLSTDRPYPRKWGDVSVASIEKAWAKTLVGYILVTGDGYDLRDPAPEPVKPTPENVTYEVTATALNGRTGPGTRYPVQKTVDKGAKITSKGYAAASDGSIWVINTENLWWAKDYLKIKDAPPNVVTPDTTVYEVTAKPSLRGRSGPGTTFPVLDNPVTGSKITAINSVETATGEVWIENVEHRFYSKEYLKVRRAPVSLSILSNNLWGYGGADSSATQAVRLPKTRPMVEEYKPDVICFQEESNQSADRIVHEGGRKAYTPLEYLDAKLTGYQRHPGGSDGRYIYIGPGVTFIAGKTLLLTPEFNGDDKQAAIQILEKGGVRFSIDSGHTENQGDDDKYRVGQVNSLLAQSDSFAAAHGVDAAHRFHAGDWNDRVNIIKAFHAHGDEDAALLAKSPENAEYKSAGVYGKTPKGERIDIIFLPNGTVVIRFKQIIDVPNSDHNPQFVVIEI